MATKRTAPRRSAGSSADKLPDRRLMEQQLAAVTRLLSEHEFGSLEEANAFLQQTLTSGGLPPATPTTPLEEAQQVVYEALEATGKRRLELARKALTISPDCADAYVLMAEEATTVEQARRFYEQGVAAAERALGPGAFTEDAGHFWGVVETRPYMRARYGLATVLWLAGERQDAIRHAQDLLRLNPGDNQGVRYVLATWLLVQDEDNALDLLLASYPDEDGAVWTYTRALHTFRRRGAGPAAEKALGKAFQANPHVPLYLLGVTPFPALPPQYYGIGDENEALMYLQEAAGAWLDTPGAIEWVAGVIERTPVPGLTAKPRSRGRNRS